MMTKNCMHREFFFDVLKNPKSKAHDASRASRSRQKGLHDAGLSAVDTKRVSISGGCTSGPTKPVVHADLGGVFVVAEAAAGDVCRSAREGGVAEIVILVLGLR